MKSVRRIVCGVSGGVDSSVAAYILKKKGYEVHGVFMRNWDVKDEIGSCSADKDRQDAEKTCRLLNIPFTEVSFVRQYWNEVFEHLIRDYQTGLTPNPDILCNRHVKFSAFLDFAREKLNADLIATGHYAKTNFGENIQLAKNEGARLLCAADTFKDQTFFLSNIRQEALQHSVFPLGGLLKSEVRKIAAETGLDHVVNRPDSTGICFIGKRPFQDFINEYIEPRPGPFVHVETGQVVGEHRGIHQWTVGQRCRIGGVKKAFFVAAKIPESQTIIVAPGTDHPSLFTETFQTGPPHWIHSPPRVLESENEEFSCEFRFQHTKPLTEVLLRRSAAGLDVRLAVPLRAITPGQYAVFYRNNECLGSARILSPGLSLYEASVTNKCSNTSH